MRRKIVSKLLIAIILILISLLPFNSIAKINDDVEISISAGNLGQDFGFGISIDVLNYRNEEIIIDYGTSRDRYFVNDFPMKHTSDFDVPPEKAWSSRISIGDEGRIYQLYIYASFEGINVTRKGISIGEFVILFN
jgi:hypothetical protein